jgi:hypothetical protein
MKAAPSDTSTSASSNQPEKAKKPAAFQSNQAKISKATKSTAKNINSAMADAFFKAR